MQKVQAHFQIILDRSGSMEAIADDIIGGFNSFLAEQQSLPGAASLSLVQFDSEDPYEVIHARTPLSEVPRLTAATFRPRGGTPLLDCIGRCISELSGELERLSDEERPERVVVVIVTDGAENASQEFTAPRIKERIRERTESGWQFVFLSADLSAIEEARHLGVSRGSSLHFRNSGEGSRHAWQMLSDRSSDFRSGARSDVGFEESDRGDEESPSRKKH